VYSLPYLAREAVDTRAIWQSPNALEAEYIACSHATQESLWLRRMMKEAAGGMAVEIADGQVLIGCDNQGTIKLITSGVVW